MGKGSSAPGSMYHHCEETPGKGGREGGGEGGGEGGKQQRLEVIGSMQSVRCSLTIFHVSV